MKKSFWFQMGSNLSFVLSLGLMSAVAHAQVNSKDSQLRSTLHPIPQTNDLGDKRSLPRTTQNALPGTILTMGSTSTPTPTPASTTPTPSPSATGVNGTTNVPVNIGNNGPLGGKSQLGTEIDKSKRGNGKRGAEKRVDGQGQPKAASQNLDEETDPSNKEGVPAVTDGFQTAKNDDDETESKTPCEDEAVKKIYGILQQDSSGVLSNLYELTSRRLALRAIAQGATSLEEVVRKDIKNYEAKIAEMKNSDEIQSQVKTVYEVYGKGSDLKKINKDFDQSFKKAKIACYWTNYRRNQRLWNEEASSYVLAVAIGEKDSGLSDADAATIWVMEKIRTAALATDPSYAYGKTNGNLLNISTRVARYLGKIGGARNAKEEEVKKELAQIQEAIDQAVERAYEQVKASLYACIEKHNQGCPDCITKAKSEFETSRLNFDKIQRGLLQAVAKAENLKMENVLKVKMGEVNFDLSDFAVGTVPEGRRKGMSQADACGNPVRRSPSPSPTEVKKKAEVPDQVASEAVPMLKPELIRAPADNTRVLKDSKGIPVRYSK